MKLNQAFSFSQIGGRGGLSQSGALQEITASLSMDTAFTGGSKRGEVTASLTVAVPLPAQRWPDASIPRLTIACIAYNHEKFISQALDGFLIQETTFPVEIIVHDDASTDGTAEIIKEYQRRYPRLIKSILQTENQWRLGVKNPWTVFREAAGEFIALCEGDDYWTDSSKLQRQVELLEQNPHYPFCFHQVFVLDENTGNITETDFRTPVDRAEYTMDELLENSNFVATASVVMRKPKPPVMPEWFEKSPYGDFPLHVWNLSRSGSGIFGRLPRRMAVYRLHLGGMYSGGSAFSRTCDAIKTYRAIGEGLHLRSRRAFRSGLGKLYLDLYRTARRQGKLMSALAAAIQVVVLAPTVRKIPSIMSLDISFGRLRKMKHLLGPSL